ncbi:hypothetical protein PhCBS80983_g05669 [Powellomyces hirtus]|uniref:Amino acid transporter transmembrane domain-containing protein n=1 Tax=Powellomyces hirtus TaxID=109895 RepID=A0A507DUS6_9FUNG|nr:hypothetical protein PhCBS80983_g05669 [Powellomyces hirtus]
MPDYRPLSAASKRAASNGGPASEDDGEHGSGPHSPASPTPRQPSPARSYGTYRSVGSDLESDDEEVDVDVEEDAPHPTGSLASSVINISNTILGSGMLAMPSALESIGLGFGIILIGLSGSAAAFGLLLLTEVAAKVGRTSSFNACSKITYPSAAVWFDVAIAVKCFGVSVSYLVICGDLLPKVVAGFAPGIPADSMLRTKTLWVFMSLAIVSPLCFLRRLDSLRYTSAFALTAVVYLVFIVVSYFFAGQMEGMPPRPSWDEIRWFQLDGSFFEHLPIFVFGFTCHQNIFSVYNELVDNTPARVKGVVLTSVGTAFSVYEIVAVLGYLTFGTAVTSNIIAQYPASPLITGGQLAIAFLVLLSYPLQCHPARASIDKIITSIAPKATATLVHGTEEAVDERQPVVRRIPGGISTRRWMAITLTLMTASLLLAVVMNDLGKVLAFVGATGSTTICYILPGLFYYKHSKVEEQKRSLLALDRPGPSKWNFKRLGAIALTTFGVFVMATSLGSLAFGSHINIGHSTSMDGRV